MNNLKNNKLNFGYLYCAVGSKYYQECFDSISSLQKFEKNINLCIFTDDINFFKNKLKKQL